MNYSKNDQKQYNSNVDFMDSNKIFGNIHLFSTPYKESPDKNTRASPYSGKSSGSRSSA